MKCTNNRMDPRIRRKASRRRRRRRQRRLAALMITFVVLIGVAATGGVIIWGQFRNHTAAYEAENYNKNVYQGTLFSSGLCVTTGEVSLDGFSPDRISMLPDCLTWKDRMFCAVTNSLTRYILQVLQRL